LPHVSLTFPFCQTRFLHFLCVRRLCLWRATGFLPQRRLMTIQYGFPGTALCPMTLIALMTSFAELVASLTKVGGVRPRPSRDRLARRLASRNCESTFASQARAASGTTTSPAIRRVAERHRSTGYSSLQRKITPSGSTTTGSIKTCSSRR
jgi:hypothetical protein